MKKDSYIPSIGDFLFLSDGDYIRPYQVFDVNIEEERIAIQSCLQIDSELKVNSEGDVVVLKYNKKLNK